MGEVFAARYELVDALDSGGSGTVWRVWDRREQAYRAGKVLGQTDGSALVRFIRETGWRVDHPHVLMPLGWAGEDDRVLLTMPLMRGGSLATLLKDYGALPQPWVLELADQLLDALAAVHEVGLVHRDVKPGNILLALTADGRPDIRLSDFGIAAPIGEPRLTRYAEVVGTPGYLAPEAASGGDPDPAQDLYAVGVTLVECLTGTRPRADGTLPSLDGLPRDLAQVLAELLAPGYKRIAAAGTARTLLMSVAPGPQTGEVVEVLDHIPELPEGWSPHGPAPTTRRGTYGTFPTPPTRPDELQSMATPSRQPPRTSNGNVVSSPPRTPPGEQLPPPPPQSPGQPAAVSPVAAGPAPVGSAPTHEPRRSLASVAQPPTTGVSVATPPPPPAVASAGERRWFILGIGAIGLGLVLLLVTFLL